MSRRTSYARAAAGYDTEHERDWADAILAAIADVSKVRDANIIALRTGEAASALLSALAFVLALSPAATRWPTALRRTIYELGKRLRRRIGSAEADAEVQAFVRSCFHGNDTGGRA
jgi:hypothetical protein